MRLSLVALCTVGTLAIPALTRSTPTEPNSKSTEVAPSRPEARSRQRLPEGVSTPNVPAPPSSPISRGNPLAGSASRPPWFAAFLAGQADQPASPVEETEQTREPSPLPSFDEEGSPTEIEAPPPAPVSEKSQPKPPEPIAFYTVGDEEYRLGAGDRLKIDFLNFSEYTGETQVLVDGSVNLALVGKVNLANLTLEQAAAALQNAYSYYVRRPSITVSLLVPRPLRLAVSGEVNNPGTYTISLTENAQFPTVTDAIEQAGGVTQSADLRRVKVRRTDPGGGTRVMTVNLWDLLQGNDLSQNIALRDGDTLSIPTATQVNLNEASQVANASFAAEYTQPLNVVVVGEVARPGSYTVDVSGNGEQPRLTRALEVAGGITPTANISQVEVRRFTRTGQAQTLNIDLWRLLREGDRTQDPLLQPGDTIIIPTATEIDTAQAQNLAAASFAADLTQPLNVAVVGEVARPGPHIVNGETDSSGRESLPTVTRAIQVAGGITQLADVRHITVRRITREGSERTIEVDLWELLQGGDLQQDVLLQPGDTIVIPTATALTPTEAAEIASASFSPDAMPVNVIGEVGQPGTVQVPPNTPLNQAIMAAGGFNNRAKKGKVELVRLNPDGTVERREIEVDLSAGIDEDNNPSLRPNDVILVGRSGLSSFTDTVEQLLPPLSILRILNIF